MYKWADLLEVNGNNIDWAEFPQLSVYTEICA